MSLSLGEHLKRAVLVAGVLAVFALFPEPVRDWLKLWVYGKPYEFETEGECDEIKVQNPSSRCHDKPDKIGVKWQEEIEMSPGSYRLCERIEGDHAFRIIAPAFVSVSPNSDEVEGAQSGFFSLLPFTLKLESSFPTSGMFWRRGIVEWVGLSSTNEVLREKCP